MRDRELEDAITRLSRAKVSQRAAQAKYDVAVLAWQDAHKELEDARHATCETGNAVLLLVNPKDGP